MLIFVQITNQSVRLAQDFKDFLQTAQFLH